ncbi:UNVERIFIED_CONTAM: hypothetical protein FKN15_071833 [Acipenser sinensis]
MGRLDGRMEPEVSHLDERVSLCVVSGGWIEHGVVLITGGNLAVQRGCNYASTERELKQRSQHYHPGHLHCHITATVFID